MKKLILLLCAALVGMLVLGTASAGGQKETKEPAKGAVTETEVRRTGKYGEAPELAELVKAGKLPKVEDRLPKEPMEVKPVDRVGDYGGSWMRVYKSSWDTQAFHRVVYDPILRYSAPFGAEVVPNVAKGWEIAPDGKSITLYLREGMKWSDGEPFTADDILFWYNDIALNKEISPNPPKWLVVGGEPAVFEKINDYAFSIKYKEPYALILLELAHYERGYIFAPKHYLLKFHTKYTSMSEVEKNTKEAGLKSWSEAFMIYVDREARFLPTDYPVIEPWKMTVSPPATRAIMERNPYYWKVDTVGNQLPYLDRVIHDFVENPEVILLKASSGELTMQFRNLNFSQYTVLKQNEKKGNYKVLTWQGDRSATVCYFPNMTAKDTVLRELFRNNKFNEALSISINREEINNVFYNGLGIPRAAVTVGEKDPAWEDDVGNMFNKFDPARANRLLDEVGLTRKDSEGYRLDKSGKPLTLVLETATQFPIHADVSEMVKDYWKEIGIKAVVKSVETTQWYNKSKANEFGMVVLTAPNTAFGNNWWLFPQWAHNSPLFGKWYATGGKEGEKPTPEVLEAQNLWDQVKVTFDSKKQTELVKKILRLSVTNFWAIGTVAGVPEVGVVSNNMGNVPEKAAYVKTFNSPGNTHPEQYFIKKK